KEIDEKQAIEIASSILENNNIQRISEMRNYYGYTCEAIKKQILLKKRKYPVVILDKFGRIRLMLDNAKIIKGNKNLKKEIDTLIFKANNSSNEDLAPQVHILDDTKIVDFSSLSSPQHLIEAIKNEIDKTNADEITIIIKMK
ncbi:MAG TPA: methylhydantoinase, partial [Nitrososphaeraceae archaeon]|nr:methylhydantoinase [Nitrososphaeraceae archaeon]